MKSKSLTLMVLMALGGVLNGNSLAMDVPERNNHPNPFAKYVARIQAGRRIDFPAMDRDRPLTHEQKKRLDRIEQRFPGTGYYSCHPESYRKFAKLVMHGATILQISQVDDCQPLHTFYMLSDLWRAGILVDGDLAAEDLPRFRGEVQEAVLIEPVPHVHTEPAPLPTVNQIGTNDRMDIITDEDSAENKRSAVKSKRSKKDPGF